MAGSGLFGRGGAHRDGNQSWRWAIPDPDLGPWAGGGLNVHLDVTNEAHRNEAVATAESALGPVTSLVNNAGIVIFGTVADMAPETFRKVIDVNLTGVYLGMHATIPSLRRAGSGVIVNVSSTAGMMGYANIDAYVASKWGVRGLTKAAAMELAADNIRVLSIHPGPIRTPMTAGPGDGLIVGQAIPRMGEPLAAPRSGATKVPRPWMSARSSGGNFLERIDRVGHGIQGDMKPFPASLTSLAGRLDAATRPVRPEVADALRRRWEELPASARNPAQLLGRRSAGCEGTHGVFPQCNFGCRPCYHSSDANRVRIDGGHTVAEVDAQMAFARSLRGPGQFAQLIGGEVSLLDPDDHAEALLAMRRHDRIPMSFSHGDFDYDYLERLALDPAGRPRFEHLSFAVHIDATMTGRRAVPRPTSEAELDGERARVAALFDRLVAEHGVRSYLAHNMTVTPGNLDEVPAVIANNRRLGYRMFSFQPAAYLGHENRWDQDYRGFGDDDVWARIEAGAGVRLPFNGLQFGDLRCNRVSWGAWVGDCYVPLLDDEDERDLATRDAFFAAFPGALGYGSRTVRAARIARSVARHPRVVPAVAGWGRRFVTRGGGLGRQWRSAQPTTFVMHRFMDGADVAAAWSALEAGTMPEGERLVATAERLQACAYSMAHPETGLMVPACVQHGVLDPEENKVLVTLLPRRTAGG